LRDAPSKVPFAPHAPQTILVATRSRASRDPGQLHLDLLAAAGGGDRLLAVSRTSIFMGRLNRGLGATLLGDHVALEKRMLRRLRCEAGVQTQLIVTRMREWRTFVWAAGCDVFTAPSAVLPDFLTQSEIPPEMASGLAWSPARPGQRPVRSVSFPTGRARTTKSSSTTVRGGS
jgi:hypothetical protein